MPLGEKLGYKVTYKPSFITNFSILLLVLFYQCISLFDNYLRNFIGTIKIRLLFYIFSPRQYFFMKKLLLLISFLMLFTTFLNAQTDTLVEHTKTGYNFGALPLVGFSTDVGVLYGIIFNIFNYHDGKIYPKYYQNLIWKLNIINCFKMGQF